MNGKISFFVAMNIAKLKYKLASVLVLVAILPSILGVHIFHHHCFGCEEDEAYARIITTSHSHEHACSDCECNEVCESCQTHSHCHGATCEHQFKKASFDGKTPIVKYKFQANVIELFFSDNLMADVETINQLPTRLVYDAILKIPDDPSPEENCVFLL
ncbi:MAG: hypothetical protein N4A74_03950 [Carboxylicivirga sp.]|nr:hypothetical protein [Carboxylicivirga sp.]